MRDIVFDPIDPLEVDVGDSVEVKHLTGTYVIKRFHSRIRTASATFNAWGGTPGRSKMRTFRMADIRAAKRPRKVN